MINQMTKENCYSKSNSTDIDQNVKIESSSIRLKNPLDLSNRTVFIIEDNPDLQFLYQRLLEVNGWKIIATELNGDNAIEKFLIMPLKPEIIILDILLPGCSGIDVAKEILKHTPEQKIIFVSGNCMIIEKEPELRHISRLSKPFEFKDLKMALDKLSD